MSLSAGQSLSFYEVLGSLGAGAMGEVYRARDTRLDREVAIKVLPEHFAEDEERLRRFEREAKSLASLNHPNVAQVFGIDQVGDTCFMAMELVPGETLEDRIARGPLPFEEAVDLGRQITEGLEAAHEAGVIHRDLKPANVRVTPDGKVKVLDFGLAKPTGPNADATSTVDSVLSTQEGQLLGTPTYMAPEQARGRPIDRRVDVWAFGCVLFECLTGKRAFHADNFSDLTAAILTSEPDWSELERRSSAATVRLVRRCLEKDSARRLRDIGDVGLELGELMSGEALLVAGAGSSGRPRSGLSLAIGVVAGILVGAGLWSALAGSSSGDGVADAPRMRLAVQLAAHQELLATGNARLAFSPDGKTLVFSGLKQGQRMLFRRDLEDPVAVPIPGTEGGEAPFFSPDGNWLAFTTQSELKRVQLEGGRPFQMAATRGAGGAAWLDEDTLVYAPIYSDGLFRISTEGGDEERLTTPNRADGELGHWWPQPLPGGRWVLFTGFRSPVNRSRIGVLDLESGETRWVVEGGFNAQYVSTGHVLYTKGTRLYAVPFDAETATTTGAAVTMLDDVMTSQSNGCSLVAVSSRGTLAYVTAAVGGPMRELVWMDRTGLVTPATEELQSYQSVSLSPDDRQAALTIQGENSDIWVNSFEHGTLSRLTSGERTEADPVWSTDGREIFYILDVPPYVPYRIAVGDPDSGRPIWDEAFEMDANTIAAAPDGKTIAFTFTEEGTGRNLYARRLDGSEPAQAIHATRAEESFPSVSPDGNWIAYQSNETGRSEIYVEAFPGPGDRFQVSANGGMEPLWAQNGELFFRHADELHVITTRIGDGFSFDPPERLLSLPLAFRDRQSRMYDVTADGQRVLVITTPDASRPRRIEIVPDWTKELEALGSN